MAQKYQNIPVKPETYAKVKLVADANDRGLGDQVTAWVERELPECGHKKQLVSIELYPNLLNQLVSYNGWYCPTCNRVYAHVAAETVPVP